MDLLFLEARPLPSHALMALLAVVIGGVQLMSAKGTSQHKVLGYIWVSLMMYVSISSFFISEIQLWGAYSPIHLLSAWTVLTLCTGSILRALATSRRINSICSCSMASR